MTEKSRFKAIHMESTPAATLEEAPATSRIELLGGDEIVELSIKPSPWLILLTSARFLAIAAVVGVLIAIVTQTTPTIGANLLVLLIIIAIVRVGIASLHWASCVYILTNRRVMRLSGMVTVRLQERQLAEISGAELKLDGVQRTLGLGTIRIMPNGRQPEPIIWEYVAAAEAVHQKVLRAIHRSQS